ncbi:MAG: diguanylate cyclase [Rhodospirillaceae bacterium]|nr:diguanylate cyclase [Rhodospirillaceae bacterium]MBT4046649.1 diguanylate cyclase [Rhodospirillaceae bacterium]MBT4686696.1 diguanylate cyclase [Rhodospirillaceae bacterium]MBT6588077.1 diguanylate cyclase [Rhodospirillaceae bacterium]MBT7287862.1 diguanylate cyclase [Rhodospirillaceae bacterium]
MANFRIQRTELGGTNDRLPQNYVGDHLGDPVVLSTDELITSYAGPVVVFDGNGETLAKNGLADPIMAALDNSATGTDLRAMLAEVLNNGGVQSKRFQLPIPTGQGVFDVTLMPEAEFAKTNGGPERQASLQRILLLARDSTFDVNFSRALVASRQLFKDLVSCSTDFVWETDAEGCFSFVSGRGLLGYTPDELDGRPARDLLADPTTEDGLEAPLNPFESLSHLDEVECWLLDRKGERTCVRASCVPVLDDDDGSLQGVRGVCRDITRDKMRQAALDRAREREQLSRSIIDSIRDALTPEEMFAAAAAATAKAIAASQIWILRDNKSSGLRLAANRIATDTDVDEVNILQSSENIGTTEAVDIDILAAAEKAFAGDLDRVHPTEVDGRQILLAPCHFRHQPKGILAVALDDTDAMAEAEVTMMDISSQLGIAMAQAEIQERLEELSSVDELTGLLNRRGFHDSVGKRIAQHRRKKRFGVLLYIDMDHFKSVNDTHGHQVGDAALIAVAGILSSQKGRQGDISGRLGGDEFAMWLEETELEGARFKAEELLGAAKTLQRFSGDADHPLSLSIGIAVADPDYDDDLDALIKRADAALYRAKRGGRGQAVLAERSDGDRHEVGGVSAC